MWNIVETFSGSRRVFFYGRHARGWKIRLHPRFAVAPRKFSAMLITDGRAPMLERAPLICMLAASLCAGYAFGSCWQWRENAKQNFFSLERRHRRSQVALTRAGTDKRCIFHCTLFSVHRHTTFVFLLVSCRVRASAKRSIDSSLSRYRSLLSATDRIGRAASIICGGRRAWRDAVKYL